MNYVLFEQLTNHVKNKTNCHLQVKRFAAMSRKFKFLPDNSQNSPNTTRYISRLAKHIFSVQVQTHTECSGHFLTVRFCNQIYERFENFRKLFESLLLFKYKHPRKFYRNLLFACSIFGLGSKRSCNQCIFFTLLSLSDCKKLS